MGDFSAARRAGGWTNAVRLADGLALRLSTTQRDNSLLREARRASLLPPAVGYPPLLETWLSRRWRNPAVGSC